MFPANEEGAAARQEPSARALLAKAVHAKWNETLLRLLGVGHDAPFIHCDRTFDACIGSFTRKTGFELYVRGFDPRSMRLR